MKVLSLKKSRFLILVFLTLFMGIGVAQSQERICLSHEHELEMREKYPQLGTVEEFESRFQTLVEAQKSQRSTANSEVLTIPIVIHLIHDGEAIGTGDNISADYVYAQIEQMNHDFRKLAGTSGFNDDPAGADTYIEFAPALVDPNGDLMPEPGINRIDRNDMGWTAPPYDGIGSSYIDDVIKHDSYWNPDLYFNFWAMDLSGGLLGYAQFPSLSGLDGMPGDGGPASSDGVVVLTASMGSSTLPNPDGAPYNLGRTATHEVGHWLGLRHIWGDGGCDVDDFVTDTPLQGFSSSGCPVDQESCGSLDMVENYMDYSNDACMNIFTMGQSDRMHAVMMNSPRRASLLNSTVHLAPFPNLVISEVMDGNESGGNPKYVELHNAGEDETYDLTTLSIRVYANGNTNTGGVIDITPSTMLAPGESYVVSNMAFDPQWGGVFASATADQIAGGISGNGDDVYELYDNDTETTVDVFGVVGVDGSGEDWEYVNGNMTRKSFVLRPNNGNFDAIEWEYASYSAETATPGSHTAEVPAFDPILGAITGVEEGVEYFSCDGALDIMASVEVINAGAATLTSVDLAIDLSGMVQNVTFTGEIGPGQSGHYDITGYSIDADGEYYISAAIADAADGNPTNNDEPRVDFAVNIFQDATSLTVHTQTDGYPGETMWMISTAEGSVIYEKSDFAEESLDMEDICLEDGDYVLTVIDTFGDGISDGFVSLFVGDQLITGVPGDHPDFTGFVSGGVSVAAPFTLPYNPITDLAITMTSPTSTSIESCVPAVELMASVENLGNVPVSTFEVLVGVGVTNTAVVIDEVFIGPGEILDLNFGLIELGEGPNNVTLQISSVNGEQGDDDLANNDASETINFTIDDEINSLVITVFTDGFPGETSWTLEDDAGNVVADDGGDLPEDSEVVTILCLEDGDYTFTINDSWGDGIDADLAAVLEDGEGNELAAVPGGFGSGISITVSLPYTEPFPDASIAITDPVQDEEIVFCNETQEVTVLVANEGNVAITDITLALGQETFEFEDIFFPAGESDEFVLGTVDLVPGAQTLTASVVSVNGSADSDSSNDLSEVGVTYTVDETTVPVQVDLHLDGFPSETSWAISDEAGNVLVEGDDYADSNTTLTEFTCLPDGCYTFTLFDSWRDGGPGVDVYSGDMLELSIPAGSWSGTSVTGTVCVGNALRPVSAMTATGVGPFQIDLEWAYDYDEDGFLILRSPTGEEGSYTVLTEAGAADRSYSDSNGLMEATTYYYAIVALRGDEQSFGTFEMASTTANFGETELLEGFEGDVFPPEGWLSVDADGDLNEWFPYNNDLVGSEVAFEGIQCAGSASWFDGTALTPDNYLITPLVAVSADYVLSYAIGAQDPDWPAENYSVLVSTSGTNTADFTDELITETLVDGNWHVNEFSLADYVDQNIYIAFRHHGVTDQFYIKLDNVFVGLPGEDGGDGVFPPTDLTATAASAYQIDLAWEHDDADEFMILRSLTGELGSYEQVEVVPSATTNTYADYGLEPETTYYYEVRAVKGEMTSVGAAAWATTMMEDLGDFKFEEGFEGDVFPPEGWISVDEDGDTFEWFHYTDENVGSDVSFEGVKCAGSASWAGGDPLTPDNYLITPEITIEDGDFFVFYVAAQDPDWTAEKYQVLVSTAGTATADFTDELLTETLASGEWEKRELDLSSYTGQTIRVAFRHFDVTDQFMMKIDAVSVGDPSAGETPPAHPTDLVATGVGAHQFDLSWTDNADNEDHFHMAMAESEFGPWTMMDDMMAADESTYSMSGMMEASHRYFRIRAANATGISDWSNIANAWTGLEVPSDLSGTVNGTSQIDLSWTDNSAHEEGYDLQTSPDGAEPWTDLVSLGADETSYSHTGLNPGTTVHYRLKASNATLALESDWSASLSATTFVLGVSSVGDVELRFYPNPVEDQLNIELSNQRDLKVTVMDYSGRTQRVMTNANGRLIELDMSELVSGLYFVTVSDGQNEVNWRIIKR